MRFFTNLFLSLQNYWLYLHTSNQSDFCKMLTHNQKIAFTSILIEMANADQCIHISECSVLQHILSLLAVDAETFKIAKEVSLPIALEVMNNASDDAKILLAKHLVEVIDADQQVHPAEIKLLNEIAQRLNLHLLF